MSSNTPSAAEVRTWLTDRIAYYVRREPADIDPDAPLTTFGLDSVYAFALCGDIEDEFLLPVEPTLVWDINTVNGLTEHLCGAMESALL